MKYVAKGHVRITGVRMTALIDAPSGREAADIAQRWAQENDLVYDGIEGQPQGRSMTELHALLAAEGKRRERLLGAFGEMTDAEQARLVEYAERLVAHEGGHSVRV